jgi:hypothetical protein
MINSSNLETDVKDIKQHLIEISKMIEELLYEREIVSMMKLSEKSLKDLFEGEEDIYTLEDLKVRYR